MRPRHRWSAFAGLSVLISVACSVFGAQPTPTPVSPTSTVTSAPTTTPRPTPTLRPTATPHARTPDQVLADLKPLVPLDESAMIYSGSGADWILTIWFVDPEIDSAATGQALLDNLAIAITDGVRLAMQMHSFGYPCLAQVFGAVHVIAVDSNDNGWFSGAVPVERLPRASDPTIDQIQSVDFLPDYIRQEPAPRPSGETPPAGACTWPEARRRLHQHFASQRQNVGFYLIIDEVGVNVWAHWDGPGEPALFLVSLPNVVMELPCLDPPADWLWALAVDETGQGTMVGRLPGEAIRAEDDPAAVIEQFEILGP